MRFKLLLLCQVILICQSQYSEYLEYSGDFDIICDESLRLVLLLNMMFYFPTYKLCYREKDARINELQLYVDAYKESLENSYRNNTKLGFAFANSLNLTR